VVTLPTPSEAAAIWLGIRRSNPLILHLTNFVVMNEQAHLTLAIGAAPLMSLHPGEMSELVAIAGGVVINIGTPTREGIEAMRSAAPTARALGKVRLVDPVGYGATTLRTWLVDELLRTCSPSFIKGNHGEMGVLGRTGGAVRGVDAVGAGDPALAVRMVAQAHSTIAISTGAVDYVSDGIATIEVHGGSPLMTRLTGTGCWLGSAVTAAAISAGDPLRGAIVALAAYGIAGEQAALKSGAPGSFRAAFFDAIGSLQADDFRDFGDRVRLN